MTQYLRQISFKRTPHDCEGLVFRIIFLNIPLHTQTILVCNHYNNVRTSSHPKDNVHSFTKIIQGHKLCINYHDPDLFHLITNSTKIYNLLFKRIILLRLCTTCRFLLHMDMIYRTIPSVASTTSIVHHDPLSAVLLNPCSMHRQYCSNLVQTALKDQ